MNGAMRITRDNSVLDIAAGESSIFANVSQVQSERLDNASSPDS